MRKTVNGGVGRGRYIQRQMCRGTPKGQRAVWEKTAPQARSSGPFFVVCSGSSRGCGWVGLSHHLRPTVWSYYQPQTLPLALRNGFLVFPSHFILHLFFCMFSHHCMYHTTPQFHSFPPCWIDSQYLSEEGPGLIFNGYVPI